MTVTNCVAIISLFPSSPFLPFLPLSISQISPFPPSSAPWLRLSPQPIRVCYIQEVWVEFYSDWFSLFSHWWKVTPLDTYRGSFICGGVQLEAGDLAFRWLAGNSWDITSVTSLVAGAGRLMMISWYWCQPVRDKQRFLNWLSAMIFIKEARNMTQPHTNIHTCRHTHTHTETHTQTYTLRSVTFVWEPSDRYL